MTTTKRTSEFPLLTVEEIEESKKVIATQKRTVLALMVEHLLGLDPQEINKRMSRLMAESIPAETKMALQFFIYPSVRNGFSDVVYEMLKARA